MKNIQKQLLAISMFCLIGATAGNAFAFGGLSSAPTQPSANRRVTVKRITPLINAVDEQEAATEQDVDDLTADVDPEAITCVTPHGTHGGISQGQCEKLLTASGCKPGAVVGDKQKCSSTK